MSKGLTGRERELCEAFAKKAKEHGYEKDAYIIGCAIALCEQNPYGACYIFEKMIDLIDVCKDDDEFIAEAGELIGIDDLCEADDE